MNLTWRNGAVAACTPWNSMRPLHGAITAWADGGRQSSRKRRGRFWSGRRWRRGRRRRRAPSTSSSRRSTCRAELRARRTQRRTRRWGRARGRASRTPAQRQSDCENLEATTRRRAAATACKDRAAAEVVRTTVELTTNAHRRRRCLELDDRASEDHAHHLRGDNTIACTHTIGSISRTDPPNIFGRMCSQYFFEMCIILSCNQLKTTHQGLPKTLPKQPETNCKVDYFPLTFTKHSSTQMNCYYNFDFYRATLR